MQQFHVLLPVCIVGVRKRAPGPMKARGNSLRYSKNPGSNSVSGSIAPSENQSQCRRRRRIAKFQSPQVRQGPVKNSVVLADTWADTTTPHGRLMLTVLGGLAEFERSLILNSVSVARRLPAEMEVQKPIERRPSSPRPFDFAVATSTSTCSRINLAIQRTLRPAGVGFTPPPERSNTATPIRCSS